MSYERFIPSEQDPSEDDSLQYFPSQESMEQAHKEGFTNASEEALNDDAAAARETQRAKELDLPKIIEGKGPFRRL